MKGLYWLILGLCIWFIPYIIMQSIVTPENPEESTTEILYSVPQEIIIVHLGIAIVVMIKAVITIRKERKESKIQDSRKEKKKSKKK
ncbi:MAG: hypothetical protein OEQ12_02475 [Nitrosopumilus sp.]|nr:hypothetical protein [Nitrosopumilus sp.]